jgi:hypothetical protein
MTKVVFSTSPTSCGCILAAITDKCGLALCRVDYPEVGWTTRGSFHGDDRLMDIAFCNGELYGLMQYRDWLVKFEIGVNEHGAPVLTAVHRLVVERNPYVYAGYSDYYARYILELRGKVVMVVRRRCSSLWRRRNYSFTMLELVDVDTDNYMWAIMGGLGDQALFLGSTCSKAVHVPEGEREGVKRNHIYYSHDRCLRRDDKIPNDAIVFATSSIDDGGRLHYKQQDNGVEGVASVEYYVKGGPCPPIWILPPDI